MCRLSAFCHSERERNVCEAHSPSPLPVARPLAQERALADAERLTAALQELNQKKKELAEVRARLAALAGGRETAAPGVSVVKEVFSGHQDTPTSPGSMRPGESSPTAELAPDSLTSTMDAQGGTTLYAGITDRKDFAKFCLPMAGAIGDPSTELDGEAIPTTNTALPAALVMLAAVEPLPSIGNGAAQMVRPSAVALLSRPDQSRGAGVSGQNMEFGSHENGTQLPTNAREARRRGDAPAVQPVFVPAGDETTPAEGRLYSVGRDEKGVQRALALTKDGSVAMARLLGRGQAAPRGPRHTHGNVAAGSRSRLRHHHGWREPHGSRGAHKPSVAHGADRLRSIPRKGRRSGPSPNIKMSLTRRWRLRPAVRPGRRTSRRRPTSTHGGRFGAHPSPSDFFDRAGRIRGPTMWMTRVLCQWPPLIRYTYI